MKKVVVVGVVALVTFALGAAGGWIAGYTTGFNTSFQFLETEVQGGLVMRADTLARLRLGKPDEAVKILEMQLDTAVTTIPQTKPVRELPQQALTALMAAKVYRAAHPGGTPEAKAVLDQVPMPSDPTFCDRSGIRQLWDALQTPKPDAGTDR